MAAPLPKLRQDLSMPGLLETVRRCFAEIEDPRRRHNSVRHTLTDTLNAAPYLLPCPSLVQHRREKTCARNEHPFDLPLANRVEWFLMVVNESTHQKGADAA